MQRDRISSKGGRLEGGWRAGGPRVANFYIEYVIRNWMSLCVTATNRDRRRRSDAREVI